MELYKIGQVVEILKKEYPDISASSLRYWEQERLILPSGVKKEKGAHRLYTEEDLEIIRVIKELSKAEWRSIEDIRKELAPWNKSRGNIEELKSKVKILRKIQDALEYLKKNIIFVETPENFYEYIYPEETFLKLLNGQNVTRLIKEAEKYNLIFPKSFANLKKYNQMDFTIMKLLIGFDIDSLEKYSKLRDFIEYIKNKLNLSPSLLIPSISHIELTDENKDLFITTALLYLEARYYEEFLSKEGKG